MPFDLMYAHGLRCMCGARLAYIYDREGSPWAPLNGYWDCAAILLGIAIPHGQEGAVRHTQRLPLGSLSVDRG